MSELTPAEVSDRVVALFDDEDCENTHIHALIKAGEDNGVTYYIVIMERQYDDQRYLNERYVALADDDNDEFDDTFMQNGINRRFPDGMLQSVIDAYEAAQNRRQQFAADERDPQTSHPFYTIAQ